MDTGTRNPGVDDFLLGEQKWLKELLSLRAIALESGLTEALKWGKPCYMLDRRTSPSCFPSRTPAPSAF